jgi:phosphoglycolate phosphatase-like HAD superfamily hydrolase
VTSDISVVLAIARRLGLPTRVAGGNFEAVLKKLNILGHDAVAIGDSPYDAEAAGKSNVRTIGVLCGGFTERQLREAGSVEVYPGPSALLACFDRSILNK